MLGMHRVDIFPDWFGESFSPVTGPCFTSQQQRTVWREAAGTTFLGCVASQSAAFLTLVSPLKSSSLRHSASYRDRFVLITGMVLKPETH